MGRLDHLADRAHFVYRCFDVYGEPLYIGMTHNLDQRFTHHRTQSPWFAQMAECKAIGPFVGVGARRRALAIEAALIDSVRPRHNKNLSDSARAGAARRQSTQRTWHERGVRHEPCPLCRKAAA